MADADAGIISAELVMTGNGGRISHILTDFILNIGAFNSKHLTSAGQTT